MDEQVPKMEELPKPQELVERALRAKLEVRQQLSEAGRRHGEVEANLRQLERQERATSRADRAMAIGKRVREEEQEGAQARKASRGGPGRREEREIDEDEQDEAAENVAGGTVAEPEGSTKDAIAIDAAPGEAAPAEAAPGEVAPSEAALAPSNDHPEATVPPEEQPEAAESMPPKEDVDMKCDGIDASAPPKSMSGDGSERQEQENGAKHLTLLSERGSSVRSERPSPRVS